jgi:phosphopantothenoylcysteine synthetase/decarboxylase
MFCAVKRYFPKADAMIGAAAVSDWRPAKVARAKLKKAVAPLHLCLVANPDILKEMGRRKKNHVMAGFALETSNLLSSAKKKLIEKNLDLIVANKPSAIGKDVSEAVIIDAGGAQTKLRGAKSAIAKRILDAVYKKARHI